LQFITGGLLKSLQRSLFEFGMLVKAADAP